MIIQENVSLKDLNTFGVMARARMFADIKSEEDLNALFSDEDIKQVPKLVLGGGSNMLFTKDYDGLVIHMNIQGISHRSEGNDVYLSAGGGEIWNNLVNFSVEHEFAGMENMSLIPGSVGASPVQNIGAYGVELMDVFHSCRAFEISSGLIRTFTRDECNFSYRDSIFKTTLKDLYIITKVTFKLSTVFSPKVTYGAIQEELDKRNKIKPTIKDISSVVSHIRVGKLPDPKTIGNAGSFFKNPIIPVGKFIQLQSNFPDIVHYPASQGFIKLAAGWLIEQCGWKGKILGQTGTWKNQALVIVNVGKASGNEIYNFSELIVASVQNRFDITLEREVNII
ncbi:UDP-N-acetylmuramate dehydrogenase [Daejeonella sp.]|uniref:UDP-N-acetylmuramate dehydrogenase n=1 Tax=Daejeonella sp. TaxID=2805397 RepID=UPI003983ACCB